MNLEHEEYRNLYSNPDLQIPSTTFDSILTTLKQIHLHSPNQSILKTTLGQFASISLVHPIKRTWPLVLSLSNVPQKEFLKKCITSLSLLSIETLLLFVHYCVREACFDEAADVLMVQMNNAKYNTRELVGMSGMLLLIMNTHSHSAKEYILKYCGEDEDQHEKVDMIYHEAYRMENKKTRLECVFKSKWNLEAEKNDSEKMNKNHVDDLEERVKDAKFLLNHDLFDDDAFQVVNQYTIDHCKN